MLVKEFAPPSFLLSNYLGGLDTKVTEGDLYSAFVPFGEIVAVHLPKNNLSKIVFLNVVNFGSLAGKPQGYGYVEFEKEQDARNSIDNMHLTEFFGLVIRCNLAHTNPFKSN